MNAAKAATLPPSDVNLSTMDTAAPKSPPPNTRPYTPPSTSGATVVHRGYDRRVEYRQVGWHGQSGAFYGLDEHPGSHEPGSYSPLWVCVENEPISVLDDADGPTWDFCRED